MMAPKRPRLSPSHSIVPSAAPWQCPKVTESVSCYSYDDILQKFDERFHVSVLANQNFGPNLFRSVLKL